MKGKWDLRRKLKRKESVQIKAKKNTREGKAAGRGQSSAQLGLAWLDINQQGRDHMHKNRMGKDRKRL